MGQTNKQPIDDEVFVIDVVSARDGLAVLNLRIRTEKNWTWYNGVEILESCSFVLLDEQRADTDEHSCIDMIERVPREAIHGEKRAA